MSTLDHSQGIGKFVSGALIQANPIEHVGDAEATWHDARTVRCWDPTPEQPFLGTPLVERETPVELKGTCVVRSNGASRQRAGQWHIVRRCHERLVDAAGVYLLAVYAPRPETPILRSVVIPASLMDEHLDGRWYQVGDDRSEDAIAQVTWTVLIDRERVSGSREVE
jgi:hypothetical protein